MNRQALIDRGERLIDRTGGGFTFRSNADRARFDETLLELQAIDARASRDDDDRSLAAAAPDEWSDDAAAPDAQPEPIPHPWQRRYSMSTVTLSIEARRENAEEGIRDVSERGYFRAFSCHGEVLATDYRTIRFIRSATHAQLDVIEKALADMEDAAIAAERQVQAQEQADADRRRLEAPLTEDERAAIDADLEHAREIAERANSTEARLGRIEGLLERVATALEKR